MRVLFVGSGQHGSWEIRALEPLTKRPHWHATKVVYDKLLEKFDVIVLVKTLDPDARDLLVQSGKPIIYDVVDGWSQPKDTNAVLDLEDAKRLFAGKWKGWKFDGIIFPTKAMQEDFSGYAPVSAVIHHRGKEEPANPIRRNVRMIGFQGKDLYLGEWKDVLFKWCRFHKINFALNPHCLAEIDIGIAVRCKRHDSFLNRRYKPNIKLANFYTTGTPCVIQANQRAYEETDCGCVPFFSTPEELTAQLNHLMFNYHERVKLQREFLKVAPLYRMDAIIRQYEEFFSKVMAMHAGDATTRLAAV